MAPESGFGGVSHQAQLAFERRCTQRADVAFDEPAAGVVEQRGGHACGADRGADLQARVEQHNVEGLGLQGQPVLDHG